MTLEYHLEDNQVAEINIYDLAGRAIKTYPVNSKSTLLAISESELQSGTYYYIIKVNDKTVKAEKLVIIK